MKRINLLTLLLLLTTFFTTAQQVPNSGFETFEADALNGTGVRPTSWNSSNVKRTVVGITATGNLVFEEAAGHTGKCVRIESVEVGAAGITEAAPGWVTLGKPWNSLNGIDVSSATAGTDGGINFKYRPDTLAIWIKRTYNVQENAHIVFYSWKGTSQSNGYRTKGGGCSGGTHTDEESDIRINYDGNDCGTAVQATQIAEAQWRSNAQFANWTEIKVPITYLTNDIPEKMNIIISSNNYPNKRSTNVSTGAKLYADDLRLIYSSAIHKVFLNNREMSGFTPSQTSYQYALGATATKIPDIRLQRSGRDLVEGKDYTIVKGAIGAPTTIQVRAEDGSSTTTYTFTFVGAVSNNPRPAGISVGGTAISTFNPYVFSYDVEVPYGTTSCPDITVTTAEAGQTYMVTKPTSLPGTATVVVTAPDGTTTQTYTLNITVGALTDNTLTDLKVNGKTVTGFKPTVNNYTVELPMGTTADPTIEYTTAYPAEHDIVVDNKGISGGVTISVTPRGTTLTRMYRLRFVVTASTYSYLKSIKIDGTEIADFDPATLTYTINLPLGTTQMPTITWDQGDEYQSVSIENGGLNGVTKITVKSQSGAISIYRLTVATAMSSVSTLKSISVGGTAIADFDPTTYSYTIALPIGTTTVPAITWEQGDDNQTVTMVNGGIDGTTRIIVTAQNGSVSTYSLTFTVAQASNSTLADIQIDGVSIIGFAPNNTAYTITLPRGTTALPAITWATADEYQEVRLFEGGINGDTRIIVKAQSGATTTYILTFAVETNSNVNLLDIKVGGASIEGFRSDSISYAVTLPSGTTVLPEITATTADAAQRVIITRGGVNGITTLLVIAEDGTQRTYTISFEVEKSANALLRMIYIGGESLASFDPSTLQYDYTIATTAQRCPTITVDKEAGQSVTIITPKITGTVRIEVTPESGAKNVYTIAVHYPMSNESRLDDITIGGVSLPEFNADSIRYSVGLPQGTVTMPVVGYTRAEKAQRVYKTTDGNTTTLTVVAEDGSTTTYTILFTIAQSAVATLDAIMLDGIVIDGFSPDRTHYTCTLGHDQTTAPAITFTRGDSHQRIEYTAPAAEGTAYIYVTAEDGSDTTTYAITFDRTLSSDAQLSAITLDGVNLPLDAFVNDTAWVDLVADQPAPVVAYRHSANQTIAQADAGYNGSELLVVAEDGTTRRYVVRYRRAKSSETAIDGIDLYIDNVWTAIADFDASRTDYTIPVAWRTRTAPIVNIHGLNHRQTVRIDYGTIHNPTTITVIAEDRSDSVKYSLHYDVAQSTISTLDAIYADGNMLAGFDPDRHEYTIALAEGATTAPAITWDNAYAPDGTPIIEQHVTYHAAPIDTTSTIVVTAQDGSTSTYTLRYTVAATSKPNTLVALNVGGANIDAFDANTSSYSFTLPYGTTTVPTIGYGKQHDAQQVLVSIIGGVEGKAIIDVIAADAATTTYTIDLGVARTPHTTLTAVTVDGKPLSGFRSAQTSYVITTDLATTPVITVTPATGCQYEVKASTANMYQVEVYDPNVADVMTYTFYFHYNADVIPNADFEDWSSTAKVASAQKPTGWTAPADIIEKWKYSLFGTYYFGKEVKMLESGKNGRGANLRTIWDSDNTFSISGSIPGMITLGDMSISPASAGKTSSSVSGNIPYRNSPDVAKLDYLSASSKKISNWRMLVTLGKGSTTQESLFEGDYNDKTNWRTATLPIAHNTLPGIDNINVTINSAFTENASGLGGTAADYYSSELHIDNFRFEYSSVLSSIMIDGTPIEGFDPANKMYTVDLPADYQGTPVVTCTGQVPDQAHRIVVNPESGRQRNVIITSVAEDGVTTTKYIVTIKRAVSSVSAMGSILVDGIALDGFDPAVTEYTVAVDDLDRLPDMTAVAASCHAMISTATTDTSIVYTVAAEDGTTTTYTIYYVETLSSDAALASITVAGHDAFTFDPATTAYTIDLDDAQAALPHVSFTKTDDNQHVSLSANDRTTISVIAEDLSDTITYTILFNRPTTVSTSTITALAVNDMPIDGFRPDSTSYTYTNHDGETLTWLFARGATTDSISQTIATDSVTITVVGDMTNRYRVSINNIADADLSLTSLSIDGDTLPEFSPMLHDYQREITRNVFPAIKATAAPDAYVSINTGTSMTRAAEARRFFTFDVATTDAGTDAVTNTLSLTSTKSATTTIAAILIDGMPLAASTGTYTASSAFDPATADYEITLHSSTPKMQRPALPEISAIAAGYGQTVTIEHGGYQAPTFINVTAENGASATYTITIRDEKSSESTLADLALDYSSIPTFDPNTFSYQYDIPYGSNTPTIAYQTADAFQTVDVLTVADSTTVTVTAENGTQSIYIINYNTAPASVTTLLGINTDGTLIDGFTPDIYDYYLTLPVGATTLPEITVTAGQDGQSISITDEGVNGTTTIHVVAEDGTTSADYRIHFNRSLSTDATLSMIYVDGQPLAAITDRYTASSAFDATVHDYTITLPVGVKTLPAISWLAADQLQTVTAATDSTDGTVVITVTPEQTDLAAQYTITFNLTLSTDATLQSIIIGGNPITNFNPTVTEYQYSLPVEATEPPAVEWIEGNQWQSVSYTAATDVDGTASIIVTAEDTTVSTTYNIIFSRTLSSDTDLRSIFIGGAIIDGFDPNVKNYNVVLATGTTSLPAVTYETADQYQTVDTISNGVNGSYLITVRAENGATATYIINFSVAKSHNAHLAAIIYNGELLNGFDPEILDYVIDLPYGTTTAPAIGYTLAEPALQTATYTPAISSADTTIIAVTAEDDTTQIIYHIRFNVLKSSNADLQQILIGGEAITTGATAFTADRNFAPGEYLYNIILPYGTDSLPEITWQGMVDDYSSITISGDTAVNTTAIITVVSQDEMMTNEYQLIFTVARNDNSLLNDLQVAGDLIKAFDPNTFEYTITFPIGTDTASLPATDMVSYTKGDDNQTVAVSQPSPTEIVVLVTAHDGTTSSAYVVRFEIELSSNTLLSNIVIDGVALEGFSPTQYEYTYMLMPGATVPTYEGIKSEESQTIYITPGTVGEPSYIYVVAEDESEAEYIIYFRHTDINPGQRPSIDDVAWTPLGDGNFRASSVRDNVIVMVYLPSGLRVATEKVGLVDPNDNISDGHHDGGTVLHFDRKGQTYIYVFLYNNHVVTSGKFSF